jgi:phosphoglucomutase
MTAAIANVSPLAGEPATRAMLVDVSSLVTAYYTDVPDLSVRDQRIAFGTSGHRGSSLRRNFNQWHMLAISQAICDYRKWRGISGPLFLGMDTHALSVPACADAISVLAANGVDVMLANHDEYTPTPAVSHAILSFNRRQSARMADGIVITPSHNPPDSGGVKYNSPNGGPSDVVATEWIEAHANAYLAIKLQGVRRMPVETALRCGATHRYDFLNAYVNDLGSVLDMDAIRGAKIRMAVDPLGGAGVRYWPAIAERYELDLRVVNDKVDSTFGFMTLDWDGQIRMDPSSLYAMRNLVVLKDCFDISFACDTDHDRHGIVSPGSGLLPANHYLAVAISYLFMNRPQWSSQAAVGKTVVSTQMIDRVVAKLGRKLCEVPVGFKWYVDGLFDGSLGFAGEESAGATFLRRDGGVWTTDKDGIVPALLAAEITARMGRNPAEIYRELTLDFGECFFDRLEAPATPEQKRALSAINRQSVQIQELAGERILHVLTHAPGNDASIGGIKVIAESGWFAARPSGTENIYKIYAESFRDIQHLHRIAADAQVIVDAALAGH